jgi:hypothetical protein
MVWPINVVSRHATLIVNKKRAPHHEGKPVRVREGDYLTAKMLILPDKKNPFRPERDRKGLTEEENLF